MKSAAPLVVLLLSLLFSGASAKAGSFGYGGDGGDWYNLVLDYKSQFSNWLATQYQPPENGDEPKHKWFTRLPGNRPKLPGSPVPEPTAALVFATGLLLLAPKLRRRR
jgi:hypothetical protein